MAIAVYPGSFDPVTNGHLDIIRRAAKISDSLYIGVLINRKKTPLFSIEERVNMLKEATSDLDHVFVTAFEGLTVDFACQVGAQFIVRGLRASSDYDYEQMMAQMNHRLKRNIDTVFLPAGSDYTFLSSSSVRELASFGEDISPFVPPCVARYMELKQLSLRGEEHEQSH